jgi:hypothetical protein
MGPFPFTRTLARAAAGAALVAGVSMVGPALPARAGQTVGVEIAWEPTVTCEVDGTYTIEWFFGATDPAGYEMEILDPVPYSGSAGLTGHFDMNKESYTIPDHAIGVMADIPGDTSGFVTAEIHYQVETGTPQGRSAHADLAGDCDGPETPPTDPPTENEPEVEVGGTTTARPAQPVAVQPRFTG